MIFRRRKYWFIFYLWRDRNEPWWPAEATHIGSLADWRLKMESYSEQEVGGQGEYRLVNATPLSRRDFKKLDGYVG